MGGFYLIGLHFRQSRARPPRAGTSDCFDWHIQGAVFDPTNAAVSDAKITITSKASDQAFTTATNSSDIYNSGSLIPGDYQVRVEHAGFASASLAVIVSVGVTANGNVLPAIGRSSEVPDVISAAIGINQDQARVQGVLSATQIDQIPINGRDFLDLAQLEPGVQIQDGINFDSSKVGCLAPISKTDRKRL